MAERLHPYAIELAQSRLSSPDPYIAIHAAQVILKGELPNPDEIAQKAADIHHQMRIASIEGANPQQVLGATILGIVSATN